MDNNLRVNLNSSNAIRMAYISRNQEPTSNDSPEFKYLIRDTHNNNTITTFDTSISAVIKACEKEGITIINKHQAIKAFN